MSIAHTLALIALFAAVSHSPHASAAGATKRYFELINVSYDSAISVSVAPAGEAKFVPIAIEPLRGGFTTTTIEVPSAHCLQDFRIGFRDGRTLLYRDINVCRSRGLYLRGTDGRQ